jgi:hypothetical protein
MTSKKYSMKANDFTLLQASLLSWIKHHQIRSINQIREACVNLLARVGLDNRNALFKIFFPLVRMGLVEFSTSGTYYASMPVILFFPKSNTAVAINLYDKQKELFIKSFRNVDEDCFGAIRVSSSKGDIIRFCKESECHFSQPEISNLLGQFPTISQAVLNFDRAMAVPVPVEYYDVINRRWTSAPQEPGMFRTSKDAQKIFLAIDGLIRVIPDGNTNPEGRPLSECYLGIRHSPNCISYNNETCELDISNITIPILVERLLRLASLDVQYAVKQSSISTTFPSITIGITKEIHRIFEYNRL